MQIENFATAAELQQYVIDNVVIQSVIVQVVFDGTRWWIFHF